LEFIFAVDYLYFYVINILYNIIYLDLITILVVNYPNNL